MRSMAARMALVVVLLAALLAVSRVAEAQNASIGGLVVGYYEESCPNVEYIVRKSVAKAIFYNNKNLAAGLLRLFFHDCFVRGCEASVLLDAVSGEMVEKDAPPNRNSLRGFEIIDEIKTNLEKYCPNTVSCADILALATKYAIFLVGGPWIEIPTGRYDGTTSIGAETFVGLPPPVPDVDVFARNFANVGIDFDGMTALIGSHTIGQAHCFTFSNRLSPTIDPTLNKKYAKFLLKRCPPGGDNSTLSFLDPTTPTRFDNKFYKDVLKHKGLFSSDQALLTDPRTRPAVLEYAGSNRQWFRDFSDSLIQMGAIGVLDSSNGEIRHNCRVRNPTSV